MGMNMKDYLDHEFWKWQAGDRDKKLFDFAKYLGVEYGALSAWMNGTRKPRRDNVAKLSEKLGPETYDVAGFARPDGQGILPPGVAPRVLSKFAASWNDMPDDLRRETEELFGTITAEEFAIFLREIIRRKTACARGESEPDDGELDEDQPPRQRGKGAKSRLLQPRAGAGRT